MLLMNPIKGKDAGTAAEYFFKSDGGYYLDGKELKREWGGTAAPLLGLTGRPEFQQFDRLLRGLHPATGDQLTALLRDDHIAAWDFTARLPKNVTASIERGDQRIMPLVWNVANQSMNDVEKLAMTRVRKGGKDADRVTANMLWLAVEHPEARPAKEDGKSDYDRHIHFMVPNATWDHEEMQWKALKVHDIFSLRKFFSHQFDLRLSAGLAELGYQLETELKPAKHGGMEYHTWDIKAAPGFAADLQSAKDKMCRRHQDIKEREHNLVAARKQRDPDAPDQLSAVAQYKLSATTRQGKVKDMTLDDLRAYWNSRLTDPEKAAIDATIDRAKLGLNPKPQSRAAQARDYAIAHHFYRSSVVDFHDLVVTAIEKSMGAATPEDFSADAWRKDGLLFQGHEVSTQAVLDQEQRIIGFAREGKGTFRPLAAGRTDGLDGLSDEQAAAVKHVWNSRDRVMLIRGAPGSGKTTMMKPALDRLGVPAVLLAPSSDASRGKLRDDGFHDADTVAAFLASKAMQDKARGGIVWIDEASLLGIDDLERVCGLASDLKARVVLQGDPRQHKSPQRHGNMLEVLADYAGLPVAEINQIQRQKGDYAHAVEAIRAGQYEKGVDILYRLGWIVEGDGHHKLVQRYAAAIAEHKGESKPILIIDPTHIDGDALTARLRHVRKSAGLIRGDDRAFTQLTALGWTPAQRRDPAQYAGDEVVQVFRNSGPFKAGQRIAATELLPRLAEVNPEHFAVFRAGEFTLAQGDVIRITQNGRDLTGKHRLDNGRIDSIAGFTKGGDITLSNGWVLAKDFAHLKHGLVSTSPASQSKDKAVTWQQLNRASLGAAGAEQFLVSLSRGKQQGLVFTDLSRDDLVAAVKRADNRKSATELFKPKPSQAAKAADKGWQFMRRIHAEYEHWRKTAAQRRGHNRGAHVAALKQREGVGYER